MAYVDIEFVIIKTVGVKRLGVLPKPMVSVLPRGGLIQNFDISFLAERIV